MMRPLSVRVKCDHAFRAADDLPPQFRRIEYLKLISEPQQTFAGVIFTLKKDRSLLPPFLVWRSNRFDSRNPAYDIQTVDRFRMNARRHKVTRKLGFEFDVGLMPMRDKIECFGAGKRLIC